MKKSLITFIVIILLSPLAVLANGDDTDHAHTDEQATTAQVSPAVIVIGLIGSIAVGSTVWFFMRHNKKTDPKETESQSKSKLAK